MSLIGTHVVDYKVQGYQAGDFKEFTAEAAKGKWAVYVSVSYTHLTLPTICSV